MAESPETAPESKSDSVVADAVKALDAMNASPAQADELAAALTKDDPVTEGKDKGAAVAKAEKDDGAKASPDAVQQQDLEWAPKSLRPKLSSLDAETLAQLKDSTLFKQAHTKLRQQEKPELEAAKKRADENAEKAGHWSRFAETYAPIAEAIVKGKEIVVKEDAPSAPADDIDLIIATPEERRAYFTRIAKEEAEKVAEAKLKAREDAKRSTEDAASQRVSGIATALDGYIADEKAEPDAVRAALVKAVAFARKTGGTVTPENVVELVSGFYEAPKANGSAARVESGGLGKVASPNGRGSGAVAPPELPAWKREKRGPKAGAETKHVAHEALKALGYETTSQGLDAIIDSLR